MEDISFYVGSLQGIPCFRTYLNTGGCADIPNHAQPCAYGKRDPLLDSSEQTQVKELLQQGSQASV